MADTTIAIPMLTRDLRTRIVKDRKLAAKVHARIAEVSKMTAARRAKWAEQAKEDWDARPIHAAAARLRSLERDQGGGLGAHRGTLEDWTRKLWDFDKHYRHPGKSLGTSTQLGISLGVALAHRDEKRLVGRHAARRRPDVRRGRAVGGCEAPHPMLIVMYNNRAYYNDWEHQIRMAKLRGTPVERAHIGMDMTDPDPDFGKLAQSMGWHGEGPDRRPEEDRPGPQARDRDG
jgi:acetolactate synthase-1/2/3 large subunit